MKNRVNRNLAEKYRLLYFFLNLYNEQGIDTVKAENIIKYKHEIRRLLSYKKSKFEPVYTHREHYGESIITKKVFDWEFDDEDKEWYRENEWMRCTSPYDCSGQWFTTDIKFFIANGKTYMYEWLSIDI